MHQPTNHFFHGGWDYVCAAKQVSFNIFQSVVRCRSLIDGKIADLSLDVGDFASEAQAIEVAVQAAFGWTHENKHALGKNNA